MLLYLVLVLLVPLGVRVNAQVANSTATAVDAYPMGPTDTQVQLAPGGGEMVVLGPGSRYVTRAGVDGRGRVRVDCGRTVDDVHSMTRDGREAAAGFSPASSGPSAPRAQVPRLQPHPNEHENQLQPNRKSPARE